MLNLNDLRREFARYVVEENQRGSFDAALFHILKIAYQKGRDDERNNISPFITEQE